MCHPAELLTALLRWPILKTGLLSLPSREVATHGCRPPFNNAIVVDRPPPPPAVFLRSHAGVICTEELWRSCCGVRTRWQRRRLRSWAKHERLSVAMALAAKRHHSAQKVIEQHVVPQDQQMASAVEVEAHEQNNAPRGQTQPPLGARPAPLSQVAGPQWSDRTVRHSTGDGLPTLAPSSLAGSAGEAVDGAALPFLPAQALEAKRKEKLKAAKLQADLNAFLSHSWSTSSRGAVPWRDS